MRRAKALAFLLPVLAVLATAVPDGAAIDRAALLRFKSSVSDPAGLLASWSDSPASDFCRWPGVTCDAASSRVVSLTISAAGPASSRLGGKLSPALSALTELSALALPSHALSGPIPPEIWRLGSLRALDLSSNELSGSLPDSGSALISLRSLNLTHNLLSGEIPPALSACVNLEALDLSGNRLTGALPSSLLSLSNLKVLSLASNRLSGPLPSELGSRCPSLEHLDLSRNLLVNAIPPGLGNCTQLQSLKLFSNLFNDAIPPELGRLKRLRALDVSRNSLSGFLPPELGGCGELSVLVLSNPYDPVPAGADLGYVDSDDFNYFQGEIPESVTCLPKLRIVWAPRSSLEGDIPGRWGGCQTGSLEMVNLGGNLLSGEVPKVFSQCWSLKFLNLSSNRLMGQLARDLPVPCMDVFDISGNQLSDGIPRFNAVSCVAPRFPFDDLSSAYSSFFAYRTQMGISLPDFDSRDVYVVYHHFGFNNFTGPLPSLPILTKRLEEGTVYAFLAGGNKLGGQLKGALFDKCKGLNGLVISLRNNLISGGIQPSIGDMCDALMVFDVAGNMITGMIPESFGYLGNLIGLDLSRNGLSGQIPASFQKLKGLKYLSLAHNKLSGPLPAGLNQLLSLVLLDLSSNFLTGGIPNDLAELRNLSTLLLDNNRLSGQIPPSLANASSLSMFNVSFNNLSGPLPSNASILKCASLVGNPLLRQSCPVGTVSLPPSVQGRNRDYEAYTYPPPAGPTNGSGGSGFNSIEIASIASAAAIVSVLLALIVLYVYTRKCAPRSQVQSSGRRDVTIFTDIGVPITYECVVRATGNFNASNCIGSGGFGATYKAEISPGVVVAIKRLSIGRFQGVQQFDAEIKTLGRWRHPNLVTLIGYHVSESEMFLIYNYLPGGNLERFIQERYKRPVDWKMLHKIALDVARALAYLHDHCVPRILHRDVKPSNILLDNDFNAYLSDFGLARLLGNSETHATTGVAGTFGYVAPEYAMTCRVSDKADVYSYGVVLLELISDKKALDPSFSPYGNGFNIVAWACMLLQQGKAKEFFTEGLWDVGPHDVLVETLHLALMCTVETLSIRPTMKQVVQRLKQLQPPTC